MKPYYSDETIALWHGDALDVLSEMNDETVDCVVTSPPYFGLRDYGTDGQYGLEPSPAEYVEVMRELFAEVRRVLAADGTFWLNIGDSYQSSGGMKGVGPNASVGSTKRQAQGRTRPVSGIPAKNMLGIPWEVAFALRADGWILRSDIIWSKPNAMPSSVADRVSSRHEHVFMFSKSPHYWFDLDPIREPLLHPDAVERGIKFGGDKAAGYGNAAYSGNTYDGNGKGRNPGDVWTIPTQPFSESHFAVMPLALAERCIKAGCRPGGTVLDPFSGSGTTGLAAAKHGRGYVGVDIRAEYLDLSLKTRLAQSAIDFGETA